jgi:hypothetical protein
MLARIIKRLAAQYSWSAEFLRYALIPKPGFKDSIGDSAQRSNVLLMHRRYKLCLCNSAKNIIIDFLPLSLTTLPYLGV